MGSNNSRGRREQRHQDAVERQEARDKRSPQDQLRRIDDLFGEGEGSKKERAKLHRLIEDAKAEK